VEVEGEPAALLLRLLLPLELEEGERLLEPLGLLLALPLPPVALELWLPLLLPLPPPPTAADGEGPLEAG